MGCIVTAGYVSDSSCRALLWWYVLISKFMPACIVYSVSDVGLCMLYAALQVLCVADTRFLLIILNK